MIKRNKLINLTLVSILGVSLLTGCSKTSDSNKDSDTVKIGITQLMEHPALDQSREGFIKALEDGGYKDGENLKIDYQNAQGDMPTTQSIASKLVSDKNDLIFAISTPSAQAAYNATKDIPVLITAVTDPVDAGLVKSLDEPDTNVTGTSDYLSIDKNLELINMFSPNAKNIGILYNTSEANSKVQVDALKEYASKSNYNVVEKGISSANEINQAMSSLTGKIDILYVPTDNLIVSSMPIVSKVATENKIPIIAAEEGSVKTGSLACQGINYYDLGYQTGEMAIEILKGTKVSDLPITTLENTQIIVNEDILNALSIEKPDNKNITYVKTTNN